MKEYLNLQKETLISVNGYIHEVLIGIDAVVELFQRGREDQANNIYNDLIEGLQWLMDALALTQDVQTVYHIKIDIYDINTIFQQINEAFCNRDYVLIGDLLEYEVAPILISWHQLISPIVEDTRTNECV